MTTIEHVGREERLEQMLTECFRGGEIRCRELRLSTEEAGYVARTYPSTTEIRHLEGCWYEISFREAIKHG